MSFVSYYFIALGLSMDAFSLSILYGTRGIKKKDIYLLSMLVGLFHFIMPNLGCLLTSTINIDLNKYTNIVSGIIFLILTIEMIRSIKENDTKYELSSILSLFLFSFAVSIDSFSIGIVFSLEKENVLIAGVIFSIVSCIFTLLGLLLGKLLNKKIGLVSKIIGIVILFILSIKYFLNI